MAVLIVSLEVCCICRPVASIVGENIVKTVLIYGKKMDLGILYF